VVIDWFYILFLPQDQGQRCHLCPLHCLAPPQVICFSWGAGWYFSIFYLYPQCAQGVTTTGGPLFRFFIFYPTMCTLQPSRLLYIADFSWAASSHCWFFLGCFSMWQYWGGTSWLMFSIFYWVTCIMQSPWIMQSRKLVDFLFAKKLMMIPCFLIVLQHILLCWQVDCFPLVFWHWNAEYMDVKDISIFLNNLWKIIELFKE